MEDIIDLMCSCGDPSSVHVDGCEQCFIPGCGCKEFDEAIEEELCPECGDTGEVLTFEEVSVGDSSHNLAPTGKARCSRGCPIK